MHNSTIKIMNKRNSKSEIANNLKKIRQKRCISQDRLSKLADLSLNTVANVESGLNPNPTIETLLKITNALDVGVDDLIK